MFEHFIMFGGAGANEFGFGDFTGVAWLDGTEGSDTYNLTLSGDIDGASNTYVEDSGLAGNDQLKITGGTGDDTMHLDADLARQSIVHKRVGESFQLEYNGKTTGSIPANATAAQVQAALKGLDTIDDVRVTGVGSNVTVWRITVDSEAAATSIATQLSTIGGMADTTLINDGSTQGPWRVEVKSATTASISSITTTMATLHAMTGVTTSSLGEVARPFIVEMLSAAQWKITADNQSAANSIATHINALQSTSGVTVINDGDTQGPWRVRVAWENEDLRASVQQSVSLFTGALGIAVEFSEEPLADTNVEQKHYRIYVKPPTDPNAAIVATADASRATVTRINAELASALLAGKPDLDAMFERPANETQIFNFVPGASGTFTLAYNGDNTTAPLGTSSSAGDIETALGNLTGISRVEVTGEGTQRNPFTIEIREGTQDARGNYFPLSISNEAIATRPMDIADAAATVRPSVSLSSPADFQRVYYDSTLENVVIRGGAGDDNFISDDSMAAMKVYGDTGNDNFLVGRVLDTVRRQVDHDNDPATPVEWIDVVNGLDGVSPGTSFNAKFYGGSGDDYFEVNHNIGTLDLFGESGDDTFFLKAILQERNGKAEEAAGGEITAGAGDEDGVIEETDNDTLIDYVENNRVSIFGGSGFDTVVVAGTAVSDTFYIFNDNGGRQFLYGAGLKLEEVDGIERLALVTGSGNDKVYLYGLNEELSLVVNMGSGDDELFLGGEEKQFSVTYPASHAVHTVNHGIWEQVRNASQPAMQMNDIIFKRRDTNIAAQQGAFKKFYQKWINEDADVTISLDHWDLLEANFTLALKIWSQAVERAEINPIGGPGFWKTVWKYVKEVKPIGQRITEYRQKLDQLEAALLAVPNTSYHVVFEESFFNQNRTREFPRLPQTISFDLLNNVVPPKELSGSNRSLDKIFFFEYLRYSLARTIWGDNVETDTVFVSTKHGENRVNPGWGHDPDLYHRDLDSRQVPVYWNSHSWFFGHGRMPHIQGEKGVHIPEGRFYEGAGAELYWDMVSLFYDVQAVFPSKTTVNLEVNYHVEQQNQEAAYRFDNLPRRTVTKILPANNDLNRIAGIVRLGGGTGNDSIAISVTDPNGLDVVVETRTLDLADYTFNNNAISSLPAGITHSDVQSALIRSSKELNIGIANRLLDRTEANTTVQVSKDTEVTVRVNNVDKNAELKLKTHVDRLKAAADALKAATNANNTPQAHKTTRQTVVDFTERARQLVGYEAQSSAKFSLDGIRLLQANSTFQSMINDDVGGAAAVNTALDNIANYLTLSSVKTTLKGANYAWTGDTALRVYEQKTPNLSTRTAKYEYLQNVWDPNSLKAANDFRAGVGEFGNRKDPYRAENKTEPLATNDLDNANSSRQIGDIEFTVDGLKTSLVGLNSQLFGNDTEINKRYAAEVAKLDKSYYTYSYYGTDGDGNRKLEMVAVRRLNDHFADVSVAHANQLQNGVYLTEANWSNYATVNGRSGLGSAFNDANVSTLIKDVFNQNLRPLRGSTTATKYGVELPLTDGLIFSNGDTADIVEIKDDAGFFIPSEVTILRTLNEDITVPNTYVTGRVADTRYEVTYDTIRNLNPNGLWFGGVENVELRFNGLDLREGPATHKNGATEANVSVVVGDASLELINATDGSSLSHWKIDDLDLAQTLEGFEVSLKATNEKLLVTNAQLRTAIEQAAATIVKTSTEERVGGEQVTVAFGGRALTIMDTSGNANDLWAVTDLESRDVSTGIEVSPKGNSNWIRIENPSLVDGIRAALANHNANDELEIKGTKYITDLTIGLGGGNNDIDIDGVDATTVISTHGGRDDVTIHALTGDVTIDSGDGNDDFTIHTLAGNAKINAPNGTHTFDIDSVSGNLNIESHGGPDTFDIESVVGTLNLESHGGSVTLDAQSLGGNSTINTSGGADTFRIGTIEGELDLTSSGGDVTFSGPIVNSVATGAAINGEATIRTSGGTDTFNFGTVDGDLDLQSRDGGVAFTSMTLGDADAQSPSIIKIDTAGGADNFTLGTVEGELELTSAGGNVQLSANTIDGKATLNTSGGSDTFNIGSVNGELNLTARDGDVNFTAATLGGKTTIDTSGGNDTFNIETINGELDLVSIGGNVKFTGPTDGGVDTGTVVNGTTDIELGERSVSSSSTVSAQSSGGPTFHYEIELGSVDGDATIDAVKGSVDLTLESVNGTLDFDSTGGIATVVVHSLDGTATIDTDSSETGFPDEFVLHSITGNSTFNSHGGNDVFRIYRIGGPAGTTANRSVQTTINAGAGDDTFCMNHVSPAGAGNACIVPPLYPDNVGIAGTLNVHGQAGSDSYFMGLTGQYSSEINVLDKSNGDDGVDSMKVFGTDEVDYMLFRPRKVTVEDADGKTIEVPAGTIAAIEVDDRGNPVVGGRVERLNYDSDVNGGFTVHGRKGDDWFIIDDNEAALTIYGDAGNDTFQVGQLFKSPRDSRAGLAPVDHFETTLTTQGYLSNGISFPSSLYGGDGNDTFNVNRNLAELSMFGENDDDTFIVRSFVAVDPNDPKKPFTNINGGQGADFIAFTVNAPVNIEGGDGLDTLTIIGTEFGDDFVVTDTGVSGAGRFINYAGVEKVVIDAMQGNDTFFIESTNENVDLEVVGGLGSDSFNVAGSDGKTVTVVSNDLKGHSGLISHTVDTDDPAYLDVKARGLAANVGDNDEAGVMIMPVLFDDPTNPDGTFDTTQHGVLRVFEDTLADSGFVRYRYAIVLTRAPEDEVQITASPTLPREVEVNAGGKGVTLKLSTAPDSDPGNENGLAVRFNRKNWSTPQYIDVKAPLDALPEGRKFVEIRHSVMQGTSTKDSDPYDRLAVSSLKVEVVDHERVLVEKLTNDQYNVRLLNASRLGRHC